VEDRPIQPPVDNRRDVPMQDVFAGRAQIPGQQDDVDMANQENIPDDIA